MRYPRGTENQRASMWLEHTRRHGWRAVAAVETDGHDGDLGTAGETAAQQLATRRCSESPTATAARRISGGSSRWSAACTTSDFPAMKSPA